eukprot:2007751-Amphidinium_carterae.1
MEVPHEGCVQVVKFGAHPAVVWHTITGEIVVLNDVFESEQGLTFVGGYGQFHPAEVWLKDVLNLSAHKALPGHARADEIYIHDKSTGHATWIRDDNAVQSAIMSHSTTVGKFI